MAPAEDAPGLRVEVVLALGPNQWDITPLHLSAGATVADALAASGVRQRHPAVVAVCEVGVWGRRCDEAQPLREADRVELTRPLIVDPKEARRQRVRRQKAAKRA